MSRASQPIGASVVVMVVAVSLTACALRSRTATRPALTSEPATRISTGLQFPSTPAATATVTPGAPVEPTGTRALVQVEAKGNLFIRRGPDLAFDPISVLPRGQTALPNGRDVLTDWLRVPLPDDVSRVGWISIMSEFTQVTGDVHALPEIEPTDWPRLAFLRNCTHHEMLVEPAGITIPSVDNFPDNDVRINPGSYSVIDVNVEDYPEVLSVEIKEGSAVDILTDGNGEKKKCPAP